MGRIAVTLWFVAAILGCLLLPGHGRATTFTQVTSDTTRDTDPAPSPDGKWIAFASDRCGHGASQIYLMPADSGAARQLTHEADSMRATTPTWAPDGRSLLFVSTRDRRYNIYSIPLEGGEAREMSKMPGSHRFGVYSPDGKKIAFYSNRLRPGELYGFNIYVMNSSGETIDDLAKQITNGKGSPGHPTWSPDGNWLAFVSKEYDSLKQNTMQGNILFARYHVYKVPASGGKEIRLTSGAVDGQSVEDTWPSWSPDGKWIAFGRQYGSKVNVWLLEVATNKTFPLTTAGNCSKPTWSHDGSSIYYCRTSVRNVDIWVARDLTLAPLPPAKKPTPAKPRPKTTSARKPAPPPAGK